MTTTYLKEKANENRQGVDDELPKIEKDFINFYQKKKYLLSHPIKRAFKVGELRQLRDAEEVEGVTLVAKMFNKLGDITYEKWLKISGVE